MSDLAIPRADEPLGQGKLSTNWYSFLERLTRRVNGPLPLKSLTVAQLPSAPGDGLVVFVSDASGGAVPAYSEGGQWLRFADNTVVS